MYKRWLRSPHFAALLAPDDGASASGGSGADPKTDAASKTSGDDGKSTQDAGTGDKGKQDPGKQDPGKGTQPPKTEVKDDAAGGKVEFSPEQQAALDRIVETRLKEDRDRRDADEAKKKKEADGKWQELYETEVKTRQQLESDLASEKRAGLLTRIAAKHALPEEMRARLVGETEAELEADAKKLAALLKPQAPDTEAGKRTAGAGAPQKAGAGAGSNGTGGGAQGQQQQQKYSFQGQNEVAFPD